MNDEDLLDLDKELNEAGGLGYDAQDKKGPKEEAKGGVTGAGSYGRHAAPSGAICHVASYPTSPLSALTKPVWRPCASLQALPRLRLRVA